MIGESPTRPHFLLVMPPVDVATAICPCASSATAPTVPKYLPRRSSAGAPASASAFSRACACCSCSRRLSVSNQPFSTRSMSLNPSANASAPSSISITCGECSITLRARRIGLRTVRTLATAPARRVWPSIIEASSSCSPWALNTAPLPALKRGDSSSTTTAAVTASSALPPLARTALPASSAWSRSARIAASSASLSASRSITPAPPWMTSAVGLSWAVAVVMARLSRKRAIRRMAGFSRENARIPRRERHSVATAPKPPQRPWGRIRPGDDRTQERGRAGASAQPKSLLAQGLDRVEQRGLARRVIAEEQAGADREGRREHDHARVELDRQFAELSDQQRADDPDTDADHAADQRNQHRLGQELPAHIVRARTHRHAQADLADTLGHRHQHDVHDADAADDQADRRHRAQQFRHQVGGRSAGG